MAASNCGSFIARTTRGGADRSLQWKELDPVAFQLESPRADVAVLSLGVIDRHDRAVLQLDRRGIRAEHVIDLVRPLPRPGVVAADVKLGLRDAVREQDLARAQPREVRAVALEADVLRGRPGLPLIRAG